MGHIYEGGSYGLFADRKPENIVPIEGVLPVPISLNSNTVVPKGEFRLVDYDLRTNGVEQAPLNYHAWVVQERLLASCTLHSTVEQ